MNPHPPSTDPAGLLGRSLDGRYQATAFIGEGELGFVYQGEQTLLRQPCVLKALRPEVQHDPARLQRVLQGSQRLTRMRLESIVRPDDVVRMPDQTVLVMPLLVGASVGALLRRHRGPLPWVHARDLLLQIGAALARLHAAGLACGGLKPSNVFVIRGSDGAPQVWLLDAMLSRHESTAASVAYMAPECSAAAPDACSDIYSLGALAHEILTAQPVFAGAPAQLAVMHRVKPPRPVRSVSQDIMVPPEVEQIVLRALAKDPQARPDVDAFLAVLRASTQADGHADALSVMLPAADPPTLMVTRASTSSPSMAFQASYAAAYEEGATQMFRRQPLPDRASRSGELPDDDHLLATDRQTAVHRYDPVPTEHTRVATPHLTPPPAEQTRVANPSLNRTTPPPAEPTHVANPWPGPTTPLAEHTRVADPSPAEPPVERTLAVTPQLAPPAPHPSNHGSPTDERTLELGVVRTAPTHDIDEPPAEHTMVLAANPSLRPDPAGHTSRTQVIAGFGGARLDPGFVPASTQVAIQHGAGPALRPSPWYRLTRPLARLGSAAAGWWARRRKRPPGNLPARRGASGLDRLLRAINSVPALLGRGWRSATRPLARLYSLRGRLASPLTALRGLFDRLKRVVSRWTGDGL